MTINTIEVLFRSELPPGPPPQTESERKMAEFMRSKEYGPWAKRQRQKWEQRNPDKVPKCRATDWSRR